MLHHMNTSEITIRPEYPDDELETLVVVQRVAP